MYVQVYVLVKFSFEGPETSYVCFKSGFADLVLLQLKEVKPPNNRTETVVFLESEQSASAAAAVSIMCD